MTLWKTAPALFLALVSFGCSTATPAATVKGKVTLDGKPLAAGKITFDALDGTTPVILDIKDGAYDGKCPLGTKTVRISAFKMVDMPKTGMTGPAYEKQIEQDYLPARFNSATKETRDVKSGAANQFDFAVTSK